MMPAGHGEGGDASKCPFAAMMKAMESKPDMHKKMAEELEEFDSDSEEEGEELEELLGQGANTAGPAADREPCQQHQPACNMEASKEAMDQMEQEGGPEAKARRKRMMEAMMSKFGGQGGAEKLSAMRPDEVEEMGKLAAEAGLKMPEGHGAGGDASSCPFAAMFGMPEKPAARPKPPSILEKYIKDNEEALAEEAKAGEATEGGCPFAAMFGALPVKDERELARRKLLEDADKPGDGQFIWKRQHADVAEEPTKPKPSAEPEPESDSDSEDEREAERRRKLEEVPTTREGLQEAIQKAGAMKSAKMKADPKRREWEMAPEWMRCTCADEGELGDARLLDFDGRLAAASKWREEANEIFRKGNYAVAITVYTKALGVFLWFKRGEGRTTENVKLINEMEALAETERSKATESCVKTFNNIATCLMKMEEFKQCEYACNKALSLDKGNVKALYRRAQVYKADNSAYMLELAVKDLKKATQLDPSNAEVKRGYRQLCTELKEQNRKDGQTFGELFTRSGGLYTEAEAEAMRKPPPAGDTSLPEMDANAAALAKQMGINLDDPRVRQELQRLEAQRRAGNVKGPSADEAEAPKKHHWWIENTLKYKWVVYALVALHVTWRLWVLFSRIHGRVEEQRARNFTGSAVGSPFGMEPSAVHFSEEL